MIYYHYHQTFFIKWNIWTPNLVILIVKIMTTNYFLSLISFFNVILSHPELKNIQNKLLNHNENFQEFRIRCDISTLYLLF